MKKKILLLLAVAGLANTAIAQDLSNCKKTCTEETLIETGPFLGVRIITAENNKHAKIISVVPNTAAEREQLAINDVITKIDGISIKGYLHLIEIIKTHQPHDLVKLEYVHNNKTKKKRVELGAMHTKVVTKTICCDEKEEQTPSKATTALVPAEINFILYPNPAINELQISSDMALNGMVEIGVFDMLGNQIMSEEVNLNDGYLKQNLNLKRIASGNYLVKIINNDKVFTNKLVIAK